MSEAGLFEVLPPERLVARVAVDIPFPHLDRLFDYEIPEELDAEVVPGCRVKVRFAGRQVNGFVIEREQTSDYDGRLAPLLKVVSPEPVLRPDVRRTARAVADRYGGVLADVLRLAVPSRHARTERDLPAEADPPPLPDAPDGSTWPGYDGGEEFLRESAAGGSPRAVLVVRPDIAAETTIAEAVAATLRSGRGVVVCVPDARDLERYATAFEAHLGRQAFVKLSAGQGPSARYRAFLRLSRGHVKAALGTRAAAFAPVHDLGLVVIIDDGDDLYSEPRAPYFHTREVLLTRAAQAGAGVLIAGVACSAEAQRLVETGWGTQIAPTREVRRASWPRIEAAEDLDGARIPRRAFGVIREGLQRGPVLIHVPRSGYRAGLACQDCRAPARCGACQGPLIQTGAGRHPSCLWCGRMQTAWACTTCRSTRLRAPVVGAMRLAEELGKAFPQVAIRRSSGEHVLDTVPGTAGLVIATPGAEPAAETDYAAAVILDTRLALGRPALRVAEECHRRWFNVAALVRPVGDGGRVVLVGDSGPVQALVRADPVGFARRELADRAEAHLPPAAHLAVIEGEPGAVRPHADARDWPAHAEILGPVPLDEDRARLIVRVPRTQGPELGAAVHRLNALRSSKKLPALRTRIDPYDL